MNFILLSFQMSWILIPFFMASRGLQEVRYFVFKFGKETLILLKKNSVPSFLGSNSLTPIELWNELILKSIISPTGNLIRMKHKSEEASKGLFVRFCMEVDVFKCLKRK